MGKHKNSAQDKILLKFMEEHQDIAKGFTKGDKVKVEALWKELAMNLNSNGPPQKDVTGWKKVWVDWKGTIRKKIAHNNSEARATGGGPFNKNVLTSTEDSIAQICGIYTVIEGITGTLEFGTTSAPEIVEDSTESLPSRAAAIASSTPCASSTAGASSPDYAFIDACVSSAAGVSSALSSAGIGGTRKRRREPNVDDSISKHIKEQTSSISTIAQQMKERLAETKENLHYTKEIRNQIKEVNSTLKKLTTALTDSNEENKRYHIQMERIRQEEILLKRQELELEERRLDFEQSSIQKKN